jgi:hypothetical protein
LGFEWYCLAADQFGNLVPAKSENFNRKGSEVDDGIDKTLQQFAAVTKSEKPIMAVHITIDEENRPFWCGLNDAQITGMNQVMRIGGKDLSIVEKFISCVHRAIKLVVFPMGPNS